MEYYKKLKKIGSGAQGECYLAQNTKTSQMCVVKEVDLGTLTPQEKQEAWNEASILQNLEPYPNVIDYFEAHLDAEGGEKLSLVLEYADNGDLATQVLRRMALLDRQNDTHEVARSTLPGNPRKLCESPFFQEKHVMLVFVQCLFGLHHLHKNSIMHRDIKTHNILLFSNGLVKLGDFGVAKSFKRTQVRKSCVGSPLYMAPEIHSSKGYTYKADIWSLGCVLHELCCLKHPYTGNNVIQLVMKVTNAPPPTSLDVPPRTYAVDLLHLINRMLQKDPDSRPSTAEIIRMPFVYKYSELLASRYKILHHFKQILEEYKGTLRDLPPASPCLEATNMRWQWAARIVVCGGVGFDCILIDRWTKDPEVKTLTEEELFPSAGGAMQTGVAEHEHTQKQGDSPEGRLASATKVHNLEYGTNTLGKLNEGAVGIVADLPWKSPATEAHNFGHAPLDDDLAVVIPDSPLKPADPHYNQNALLGDRELHFLLDALMPNAGPVSGGNDCPLRKVSSLISSASQNAHFFDEIPSVNGAATQATLKVCEHPEFAVNQYAQDSPRGITTEAQIMQPVSKIAGSDASAVHSQSRPDEAACILPTQSIQPGSSGEVPSASAQSSTFPHRGKHGQGKAKRFWAKLCCRGNSDGKYSTGQQTSVAELQSNARTNATADASEHRSILKPLQKC